MPELPEVEVVCRGLQGHLSGKRVQAVGLSGKALRSFSGQQADLPICGQQILGLQRRAKNLIFTLDDWWMVMHLGMSGQLLWLPTDAARPAHSHVWLGFEDGQLVYNDPRRFGDLRLAPREGDTAAFPQALLGQAAQGREPLAEGFDGAWLYDASRGVRQPIKPWLMRGDLVVGVGNIYASEALFRSGIHPARAAGRISKSRYEALAVAVREVLLEAIAGGGSSLRDFVSADGLAGHFAADHRVYGRQSEPCRRCGQPIRRRVQAQRATYFCAFCQR
ncbi:MAG: formamidopyrimidine-DNA glycosylase [Pseudomonadota bacterium]|jgi:formamidopyrimidine-DNA glycosylase